MIQVIRKNITFAVTLSGIALLVAGIAFTLLEPTIVRGQDTDVTTVNLTVDAGISITNNCSNSVTMTDDSANNMSQTVDIVQGECATTISSNNASGYKLEIEASTDPAMQHTVTADEFDDYTEATPGTPEQWSVGSGVYEFGFSAVGADVPSSFDNALSDCDTAAELGSGSTLNYRGFSGVTKIEIATSNSPTSASGTSTTMCFGAEQNNVFAPAGAYQATVTLTATNL